MQRSIGAAALRQWRQIASARGARCFSTAAQGVQPSSSSSEDAREQGNAGSEKAPPLPPLQSPLLQAILRADLAAEEAAVRLLQGQRLVLRGRPDAAALHAREQEHLDHLRQLAVQHRVRPSALAPALGLAFGALGASAAAAPRSLGAAVSAGVADALTDIYNEQLRELREGGLAEAAPAVRQAVRALRDEERTLEGAPPVPDLLSLRRLGELSPAEGVAAAVKLGTKALLDLARRV